MTSRLFVDTNAWVCTVDNGEPDKQAQARLAVVENPFIHDVGGHCSRH